METPSKLDTDFHFYRREFLNLPGYHSHGHIIASIYKNKYEGKYMEASIDISDCCKHIRLDIGSNHTEPDTYENAMFKFDTLIRVLTEMRDAYKETVTKVKEDIARKEREKEEGETC